MKNLFLDAEHISANRENRLILRIWIIEKSTLSVVVVQCVKNNSRENKYYAINIFRNFN